MFRYWIYRINKNYVLAVKYKVHGINWEHKIFYKYVKMERQVYILYNLGLKPGNHIHKLGSTIVLKFHYTCLLLYIFKQ